MHRYRFGRSLGEGAFGQVRQAVHKESGDEVAIKTLKDRYKSLDDMMSLPEVKALRSLSHENIVHCRELVLNKKGQVHIVFEMLHGGNLETLTRKRTKPLLEHQIRSVFFQLLSAVQYMHSLNFLHRDIKPENILLLSPRFEKDTRIKLADLGLAKRCISANARPHTTYVATRWYRSPELLLRISSYSFPSDLWAIGAVMAELINLGEPLFPGQDEIDQLSRIVALRGHPSTVRWRKGDFAMKNRRIQLPRVTPSSLRRILPRASLPALQLISDLLEMDPARRPTAAEALRYPLFISSPPIHSEQNRSRKKRRLGSADRDTARTRDFPSSRWSNGTDENRDEQCFMVRKQLSFRHLGSSWTLKDSEQRVFTSENADGAQHSKLFQMAVMPGKITEDSEDYQGIAPMRNPAGEFNMTQVL